MKYENIIALVSERAGLFEGEAVALTRATLTTLSERISGGEVRDLAAQLPGPLQDALLPTTEEAEAFSLDEFVDRVAARSGLGPTEVQTGVVAVLTTLREAVTPGEFEDVLSQLPDDFARLGVH